MTDRAARIADAIGRIMGPAAMQRGLADAVTNTGTAVTLGSMAVMGMAALARLDPAVVEAAVKGLWVGGAAFGAGVMATAALGEGEALATVRDASATGNAARRATLARIDGEVELLAAGLAPRDPEEAPTPGMR